NAAQPNTLTNWTDHRGPAPGRFLFPYRPGRKSAWPNGEGSARHGPPRTDRLGVCRIWRLLAGFAVAQKEDLLMEATAQELTHNGAPMGRALIDLLRKRQDQDRFREQHWEGSFDEYLDIVAKNPKVARTAFE